MFNPPINYMFIDGNCLIETIKNQATRFGCSAPELSWPLIRTENRKVFYFDAVPVTQKGNETPQEFQARVDAKKAALSVIEREPGFHVRTGNAVWRRQRGSEQKMVDVQLAVNALQMASRGLFQTCNLITGDLDFRPLVDALVEMGVEVHLIYPPDETSPDLIAAADRASPMTIVHIQNWFAPTSQLRQSLPHARFDLQASQIPPGQRRLHDWNDGRFGHCIADEMGDGMVRVVTERGPHNDPPATHRLQLAGANLQILRIYAHQVFQLTVPEW